jgi:hypothetical protein
LRFLIFILSIGIFSNCKSPQRPTNKNEIIITADDGRFEGSKCYTSKSQPTNADDLAQNFKLSLFEATFKTETKTYYLDKMLEENPDFKRIQLKTAEGYLNFIIADDYLRKSNTKHYTDKYNLCLVYHPPQYQTFAPFSFTDNKLEIELKVVKEQSQIIKTLMENKPESLKIHEYYVKGHNWSDYEEIDSGY